MNDETVQYIPDNAIISAYRGSIAHNLYVSPNEENGTDDVDVMNVVIERADYYFNVSWSRKTSTEEQFIGKYDIITYEASKFIGLLLSCNPNVLSLLWTRPEHYFALSQWGIELINMRDQFLQRDKVFMCYSGYGMNQLDSVEKLVTNKANLGEKRRNLVETYGYDTKYASHAIRLLKMGAEILETGNVIVYREHDREELLDIKNGKWNLDKIKHYAAELLNRMKKAQETSPLPEVTDKDKIQAFASAMIFDTLQERQRQMLREAGERLFNDR